MALNVNLRTKFDIDRLIEPYQETKNNDPRSKRSLTSIVTKLIVEYRFPPQVVGAACFKVFYKMAYDGLEFHGNGIKGSKGAELFSCIKAQCVDIVEKRSVEQVLDEINQVAACTRLECKYRTNDIRPEKLITKVKRYLGLRVNKIAAIITLLPPVGVWLWLYITA